jgi:RimJ/RimL family protein N-acetyltransferase
MELRTPTCTLRPFRPSDAERVAHHANNRRVWLNLRDAFPHPYTVADAERYIAHAAGQPRPTSFAIEVGGDAVGSISLKPRTDIERLSAEVGYWLGEAHWGRGVMTAAVRAATGYAFDVLGLVRVFAVPFTRNVASARVLERAGYALEGTMRRSAIKDGEVLDQHLYASVRPGPAPRAVT